MWHLKRSYQPTSVSPGLTWVGQRCGGASYPVIRVPPLRGSGRQLPRRRVEGGGQQRWRLPGELRGAEAQAGTHTAGHGGRRWRPPGCGGCGCRCGGGGGSVVMRRPVIPCGGRRRRVRRAPAAAPRPALLRRVRVVAQAVVVVMVVAEVWVLRRARDREVLLAEAEPRVAGHRVLVRVHGGVLIQLQVTNVHISRWGDSLCILRIQPASLTWSPGKVCCVSYLRTPPPVLSLWALSPSAAR